jgi:S1-C subfamily serine protease
MTIPSKQSNGFTAVIALGLITMSGTSLAQDVGAESIFGSVELTGNFQPDPYTIELSAGGSVAADSIEGCSGYISNAPDYKLDFTKQSDFHLSFFVISDADTTLVINDPSGVWHCDDDYNDAGGTNPGVIFADPQSGIYDIWVGTYEEGDSYPAAELVVTEIGPPWSDSGSSTPDNNNESGTPSSGTGFIVSQTGHVLTNHHVIDGCSNLTFQLRGQLAMEASLISSNSATDLALLKISLSSSSAVFRGSRRLRLGDEVVVYGFPLLGDLSSQGNLTYGIVSALSGLEDDLSRLQMTAQIQPGNSGGPVLNRFGEIVGVVVETANEEFFRQQRGTDTQNLNFAIRDSMAVSFLETNNVNYAVGGGQGSQMAIADIAEAAQEFTGLIMCYQ